ncbi:MAG: FAD:protein FMN transferase [Acidobacteriota bacterium]
MPSFLALFARRLLPWSVMCCAVGAADATVELERTALVMGTEARVVVEAIDRETAIEASEAAFAALNSTEARLSSWRPESELSRLAAASAGTAVEVSAATHAELLAAWRCAEETSGAFDPAIGPLSRAWGLRGGAPSRPSPASLASALAAADRGHFRLTAADPRIGKMRSEAALDAGGFGKGAGLGRALEELAAVPGVLAATVDLGGQVAWWPLAERAASSVQIADPDARQRPVVEAVVRDVTARGSVATSGNGSRGLSIDGRRHGHLLDPRTGRPAPDFGSLTVFTADPLRADCLSTGLYVLGPEAALAWAKARVGVEVLVLERTHGGLPRVRATSGLEMKQPELLSAAVGRPELAASRAGGG